MSDANVEELDIHQYLTKKTLVSPMKRSSEATREPHRHSRLDDPPRQMPIGDPPLNARRNKPGRWTELPRAEKTVAIPRFELQKHIGKEGTRYLGQLRIPWQDVTDETLPPPYHVEVGSLGLSCSNDPVQMRLSLAVDSAFSRVAFSVGSILVFSSSYKGTN